MATAGQQPDDWERLFWTIFDRSSNAMALVDDRRINVEVNPAMTRLLGISRTELIGTHVEEHVALEERATVEQEWRELLRAGERTGERTVIRGDGSRLRLCYAARTAVVGDRRLVILVLTEIEPPQVPRQPPFPEELTRRECQILHLVALGQSSPEIAERLVISNETVRTHVRNAMTKLGARTRAQLVAIALSDRLCEPIE